MELHQFFLFLAIILISARVFSETVARFGIPSVIGELLAGLTQVVLRPRWAIQSLSVINFESDRPSFDALGVPCDGFVEWSS